MRSLSAQQPSISVLGEAGDFALNRTAASAGFSHAFRIDGRVLRRGLAPVVTLGDDATGSNSSAGIERTSECIGFVEKFCP